MAEPDLTGRTCIVTGASSGIGEETALALARFGARVLLVCRSAERGERARRAIEARSGNPKVELFLADLARQEEIRRVARELLDACPAIHVLVNNAGLVRLRRSTTPDGLEETFAVNHLAYFLLTNLLLERIAASAPARIVNVSSDGHKFGRLDLDDLQSERGYRWWRAYGTSKLANVLFTTELARRLEGTGVTANCLHPGAVATRLGHDNAAWAVPLTRFLALFFKTPAQGAATSIHLASSDAVAGVTGRYFVDCAERQPSAASRDVDAARRLWDASLRLTGLDAAPSGAGA